MSHCVYDVENNNNDIVKHTSNTQINSLSAKLSNFNFHSLEVVSRYRDPQLPLGEHYSHFFNLSQNICKYRCLNTLFVPNNGALIE